MTTDPIRVDVWSDVQCIWCYIASARLRTAIQRFPGPVDVTYHSYQLTPDAPIEIDRERQIQAHGGDPVRMQQIMTQLRQLAAAEELAYDPDLTQPTNSRAALELLHHAEAQGKRAELTERLFTAYFAEGRHIGRIDELLAMASDTVIDPDEAREALEDHRHAAAVDADVARAQAYGARGVPFYVINNTWGLSGAQPVDQYLATFQQAASS